MATYVPIASYTFSSSGSSYSFTGIPTDGTYTDLVIRGSGKGTADTGVTFNFNGDTTGGYYNTILNSWGSTLAVEKWNSNTYRPVWNAAWNTTTPGTVEVNINSYAVTGPKTAYGTNTVGTKGVDISAAWWNGSTAAINRVDVFGSFAAGTKFTIFGIKAGV